MVLAPIPASSRGYLEKAEKAEAARARFRSNRKRDVQQGSEKGGSSRVRRSLWSLENRRLFASLAAVRFKAEIVQCRRFSISRFIKARQVSFPFYDPLQRLSTAAFPALGSCRRSRQAKPLGANAFRPSVPWRELSSIDYFKGVYPVWLQL